MNLIQSLVAFLGRALLSIIFISSAIHHIADWQGSLQYFNQALTDWLALSIGSNWIQTAMEWGIANASALLIAAVVFQLVGGLLVFFGLFVRLGALLLFLFLVPTTLIFHHFWLLLGLERQVEMIQFMKNVSIGGGLLYAIALGKGGKAVSAYDKSP